MINDATPSRTSNEVSGGELEEKEPSQNEEEEEKKAPKEAAPEAHNEITNF